jgi:hypothetical protein
MEPHGKPANPPKDQKVNPRQKAPENYPDTPKNKFTGKLEKKTKKEQN